MKTSYQKLRDEVKELRHDINVIVNHSETEESFDIWSKYVKEEDDIENE